MPMLLSLMVCTVTFPVLARALAAGRPETGPAPRRARPARSPAIFVLLGAAYLIAFAPQIVAVLFQRGEFDRGRHRRHRRHHAGLRARPARAQPGRRAVRPFFSGARPTWYPAARDGRRARRHRGRGGDRGARSGASTGSPPRNARRHHHHRRAAAARAARRVVAVDVRGVAAGLARLMLAAAAAAAAAGALPGSAGPLAAAWPAA